MRCAVPPTQPPAAARPVIRSDLSAGRGAGVLREVPAASDPPAAKLHSRTWEMFSLAEAARSGPGAVPERTRPGGPLAPREGVGKGAFWEYLFGIECNQSHFWIWQCQL